MPKDKTCNYNKLNVNKLPPPNRGGKENDLTYSRTLAKLLRRFVRIAVPDPDELSFNDAELLDDLIRLGSLNGVALYRKCSMGYVRSHLITLFDRLEQRVRHLETASALDLEEQRVVRLEAQLAKMRQHREELEAALQQETADVRALTLASSEKRRMDKLLYLREHKRAQKFQNHLPPKR